MSRVVKYCILLGTLLAAHGQPFPDLPTYHGNHQGAHMVRTSFVTDSRVTRVADGAFALVGEVSRFGQ